VLPERTDGGGSRGGYPTAARDWRAISNSSFVGMTSTCTRDESAEMRRSPRDGASLRAESSWMPNPPSPARAAARTSRLFSPTPAVKTIASTPVDTSAAAAAAEQHEISAEVVPQPRDVDVEGEASRGIPIVRGILHIAQVAGSREPEHAATAVEQGVDLRKTESATAEVQQCAGVDVPRPRPHDEARERGHSHGCIDRAPAVDRTHGRAVAEVEGDQLERLERPTQHQGGAPRDVLIRGSVKSVPSHPMPGSDPGIDSVRVGRGRERVVERRVEHGHIGHAREGGSGSTDAGQVGRVMQRGERGEGLDSRFDHGGDERSFGELAPAVHHSMPDHRGQRTVQLLEDAPHPRLMIGGARPGLPDSCHLTRLQRLPGRDIDPLPLDRG